MLLQGVGSAAAYKDRREEGGACRLSCCACPPYRGISNLIKTRRHGKGDCTHLTNSTHACWRPAYRRIHTIELRRAKFGSCHTAMLSMKITVFATAINQNSSQHGALSNQGAAVPHNAVTVSSEHGESKGPEREPETTTGNTTGLSNKNVIGSEQHNSAAPGSKKLTERFTDFKTWWNIVHDAYKEDSATWGYGASPIFTVYLGPIGQIERVVIDEGEIQRRQGADGFMPGLDNSEHKEQARQKVMLARSIAKDLESGKRGFNRHSTVFSVVQHSCKYENLTGRQKLLNQIDTAVHRAAPILKWTMMIAIPLYGISILIGTYLLVTKRSETDLSNEEKSEARLERMRNLKAQMNTHKGNTSAAQPSLAPSEFMEKLLEVREMARKVREEEGVQKLVEDSDAKVEEYQPEVPGSPVASESSVVHNMKTEQGGDFNPNSEEEYQREVQVLPDEPTLEDVKMTASVVNVNCKPTRKVRPRIITSIDEAMTILGTKESDVSGIAGRVFYDGKPHSDHNAGKVHEETVVSYELDSISSKSENCEENSHLEAHKILATNHGEQDRENQIKIKNQIENYEGEMPSSDMNTRLDQPYAGTLNDIESKGSSTEGLTLEHNSNSTSENGQLDEIQVSLMTSGEQVEQLPHKNQFDKISAEISPSTCSDKARTHDAVSGPVLSMEPDEIVGSGQPLHKKVESGQPVRRRPIFSNTKRWSKELQRKYDLERDPEIRELMKEIGSDLDSWITEEEIEETVRLAEKLEEGDDEYVKPNYKRIQTKIREEKERFGLDAVLEKYKEYQPKAADEFWWLDLRCVLCLMVVSKEGEGFYGLDMTIDDDEGIANQRARHVVGFEDRKDASNFCHLLELKSGSRFRLAEVRPFSPKKLLEVSKEEGFRVTVLRSGQIHTHVDQTLEEVEDKILEIGRSVYWDKLDREHSIDIDSILHQRFGL